MKNITIKNINELLKLNLSIPSYQRPYTWSFKSVQDLYDDIKHAYERYNKDKNYKYRIGTIILYENNNSYEIVDGQQRIITLLLMKLLVDNEFECNLLNTNFSDKTSIINIRENYNTLNTLIKAQKIDFKKIFNKASSQILEVLIVKVKNIDEAFQLFDSQNSSGKELYPHDLLKAFHLREMSNEALKFKQVSIWEKYNSEEIHNLFNNYLFPSLNWINMEDNKKFTSKYIDSYKGITKKILDEGYNYANIIKKHYYLIGLPFYSGEEFFEMVKNYRSILNDIFKKLNNEFSDIYYLIYEYLHEDMKMLKPHDTNDENILVFVRKKSIGLKYVCILFITVLMYFYNKFGILDKFVIINLFKWAFMLRVDLEKISLDSINSYVLSNKNNRATNHIAMFTKIQKAVFYQDICNINIKIEKNGDNWVEMYNYINNLNVGGYEGKN